MAACGSQPPAGRSGNTGQDSSEPNLNLPVNLNFTSDHSVPEAVPAAVLGSSGRGRPACAASCHSLVVGPARQGWQFSQARQGPARPRLRAWAAGGLRLQVPGSHAALSLPGWRQAAPGIVTGSLGWPRHGHGPRPATVTRTVTVTGGHWRHSGCDRTEPRRPPGCRAARLPLSRHWDRDHRARPCGAAAGRAYFLSMSMSSKSRPSHLVRVASVTRTSATVQPHQWPW